MIHCTTQGIVLQRRSYSDFDYIITLLTEDHGKQTTIAKSAKKSNKRFPGVLEPFAELKVLIRRSRTNGLHILEEATLVNLFPNIRNDIIKTAYASYWVELISLWVEENENLAQIYELLSYVLTALNNDLQSAMLLSVLFQIRFLRLEGLSPIVDRCSYCKKDIDSIKQIRFQIDVKSGGLLCNHCLKQTHEISPLAKRTIKKLQWINDEELEKAFRVKFQKDDLVESLRFLEKFVPYHFGHVPKSLIFLRQVRKSTAYIESIKVRKPHE
jgi:DNA repair protein RecO (recombination protein O)